MNTMQGCKESSKNLLNLVYLKISNVYKTAQKEGS